MREYQFVHFGRDGRVAARHYLRFSDDEEAIKKGRFIHGSDDFECWEDERQVFPPKSSAS